MSLREIVNQPKVVCKRSFASIRLTRGLICDRSNSIKTAISVEMLRSAEGMITKILWR